jgi:hypothetical protein
LTLIEKSPSSLFKYDFYSDGMAALFTAVFQFYLTLRTANLACQERNFSHQEYDNLELNRTDSTSGELTPAK